MTKVSYTAKTWKTGEAITANALNNLESGTSQNASDIQQIQNALPTYVGDSITKKAAATYTPGTSDQTIDGGQYLSGTQTIEGDRNLIPGNIKNGTQIFNVTGTYTRSGGTLPPVLQTKTVTPTKSTQNITPDDNYDGLSEVTVNPIPSNYIESSGNKSITANGTGIDVAAYSTVSVNVPTSDGLDTSDATVTPGKILKNYTAYARGAKLTGLLDYYPYTEGSSTYSGPIYTADEITLDGDYLKLSYTVPSTFETAFLNNSKVMLKKQMSGFGDATAADVAAGKTFTSAAGLKVTGTATGSSGDSSGNNFEVCYLMSSGGKLNFQTSSGTIKVWGYGKGSRSTEFYTFCGDHYYSISYSDCTKHSATFGVNSYGQLTGLPTNDIRGFDVLVTKEG